MTRKTNRTSNAARARKRRVREAKTRQRLKSVPLSAELVTADQIRPEGPEPEREIEQLEVSTPPQQRFVARMMSMGLVDEEMAGRVLKKAYAFAAGADNVKTYATAMNVIATAVRLEQSAVQKPITHQHVHATLPTDRSADIRATIAAKAGLTGLSAGG